jgi:hypothetical protein
MAEDESSLEGYHYWGAVVFGFLGSFLLWLAIGGESLLVRVAWMPIALVFIGAMLFLPEPGASMAQLICAAVGYRCCSCWSAAWRSCRPASRTPSPRRSWRRFRGGSR